MKTKEQIVDDIKAMIKDNPTYCPSSFANHIYDTHIEPLRRECEDKRMFLSKLAKSVETEIKKD
jgi:hypothetical protein